MVHTPAGAWFIQTAVIRGSGLTISELELELEMPFRTALDALAEYGVPVRYTEVSYQPDLTLTLTLTLTIILILTKPSDYRAVTEYG